MALIEQLRKQKRSSFLKKSLLVLMLGALAGLGYWYFFPKDTPLPNVNAKTVRVVQSDLKTSIESDGMVLLKDEYHLDFVTNGIIKNIFKNEGDTVKAGDVIASLDTKYVEIDIQKAQLSLQNAQSIYELKRRGVSQDEIDLQNLQVQSNQLSLEHTKSQIQSDLQTALENEKNLQTAYINTQKQAEVNALGAKNALESAKIDFDTAKESLSTTESIESQKYLNAQNKLIMDAGQLISNIEKNLYDVDLLLGVSNANKNQNDAFELYLGAKNQSLKMLAETSYRNTQLSFDTFYSEWKIKRPTATQSELIDLTQNLREVGSNLNKTINDTILVLKSSVSTSDFPQSTLDTYIANFEKTLADNKDTTASFAISIQSLSEIKTASDEKILGEKSKLQALEQKYKTALTSYDKSLLENEVALSVADQKFAQATKEVESVRLKNESILSKETSTLDMSQGVLDSKMTVDPLELESYVNAINLAQKSLEEAKKKLQDSQLIAPVSGKIVEISAHKGELSSSLKDPFVTLIDTSSLYVESLVEEGDIVKIHQDQLVDLSFDALEGVSLTGTVVSINDKANIDSSGVVTYQVKIFISSIDPKVRDGMSANVEFITKEVKHVFVIPVSAVKTLNQKPSVYIQDGSSRAIVTGFTDGKMVQVISGLQLGDVVQY